MRLCITFVEMKETLSARSSFLSRTRLHPFTRTRDRPRHPPLALYPHPCCFPSLPILPNGDAHRHGTRAHPPQVNATVQNSPTATTPLSPMTLTMAKWRASVRLCDHRRSSNRSDPPRVSRRLPLADRTGRSVQPLRPKLLTESCLPHQAPANRGRISARLRHHHLYHHLLHPLRHCTHTHRIIRERCTTMNRLCSRRPTGRHMFARDRTPLLTEKDTRRASQIVPLSVKRIGLGWADFPARNHPGKGLTATRTTYPKSRRGA